MFYRSFVIIVVSLTAVASADTIHYGDFESPGMFFTDVTESSGFDELPLYGAPSITGDGLEFLNSNFEASSGANQVDFVDGRVAMTVVSKHGQTLTGITLHEAGTFINSGPDMEAAVSAIAFAVADNKVYNAVFSNVSQAPTSDKWEDTLTIQFDHPVSSFSFVLDNQLFAFSGAESTAFVNKDLIKLSVNVVPEPVSGSLLLTMSLLGLRRRRRNSSK